MSHNPSSCEETFNIARGDQNDPPEVRLHLAACGRCRREVSEVRSLARAARLSLSVAPAAGTAQLALRRLHRAPVFGLGSALAFAGAASIAFVAVSALLAGTASRPAGTVARGAATAPADRSPAATGPRVVVEVQPVNHGRVPFEVRSPSGTRRGSFEVPEPAPLETIPANPVIVDTF